MYQNNQNCIDNTMQSHNDYKGLICINQRWPPCDLANITLRIVNLEQMKIETCIMFQND